MANGNGEALRAWWPVIVFTLGLAVTWGSLQTQVSALADDVDEVKQDDALAHKNVADNNIKVEVLATKQATILEDVKEIKAEQKEQGEQLDRIEQLLREKE